MIRLHGKKRLPLVPPLRRRSLRRRLDVFGRVLLLGDDDAPKFPVRRAHVLKQLRRERPRGGRPAPTAP